MVPLSIMKVAVLKTYYKQSDDGAYEARRVKQTATRKRKALTMLGSSRRKVKR